MAAISLPEQEFGAHKRAYFGKRARSAAVVAVGVTLASISPSSAQQGIQLKAPVVTATTIKKMSETDCKTIGKFVELQVDKYGDKLSDESVTDWSNYVGNNCVGIMNGKPLTIRILTSQDDMSGSKVQELMASAKVNIGQTGLDFVYPKGTPKREIGPAGTGPANSKRSSLPTRILANNA